MFLLASLELWLASPLRWHWLRRRSSLQRRATASGYIQQLLAVLLAFTPAAPGRSAALTAYHAGLAEAVLPRPPFVYYRSSLMAEKRRSWANFAASSVLWAVLRLNSCVVLSWPRNCLAEFSLHGRRGFSQLELLDRVASLFDDGITPSCSGAPLAQEAR